MKVLKISACTVTTALGHGCDANLQKLLRGESGLTPCDFDGTNLREQGALNTWIGKIPALEHYPLSAEWKHFECRNNALSMLALQQDDFYRSAKQVIEKYGADRVALFMGTSTSGIHQTELAYRARADEQSPLPEWFDYQYTHNLSSTSEFVRCYLGLNGFSHTISTACSSSAKVFASAARAIAQGVCDAAIVGGTDTLCLTTLYGFRSLQLLSAKPCKPSDRDRDGISIGEASGFVILEADNAHSDLALLGSGESSDAYHMSHPHPEGAGARLAMQSALRKAAIMNEDIDYINLHGTGTKANDQAEANAIQKLFYSHTPCSSTKGWTGHTLGAAGVVELVFSVLAIKNNVLFQSLNTEQVDTGIMIPIQRNTEYKPVNRVLSNSFGFGGNNCSLIVGRVEQG